MGITMARPQYSHMPSSEQDFQDLLELLDANDDGIVTGIQWPRNVLDFGRRPQQQAAFLQQSPPQPIGATAVSIGGDVSRTAAPQSLLGKALLGSTTVTRLLLGVWDLLRYELGDVHDEDCIMHFFTPLLEYFRTTTTLHYLHLDMSNDELSTNLPLLIHLLDEIAPAVAANANITVFACAVRARHLSLPVHLLQMAPHVKEFSLYLMDELLDNRQQSMLVEAVRANQSLHFFTLDWQGGNETTVNMLLR